jgi:hypothetical protein
MIRIKKFTEQVITIDEIKTLYMRDSIPEGWFIHGRRSDTLATGRQIELSRSWSTALYYATESGYIYFVKPDKSNIFDVTIRDNALWLGEKLIKDYEEGELPSSLSDYVRRLFDSLNSEQDVINQFADDINPNNIADSANFWDFSDNSIIMWLYDTTNKTFFITSDGAVDISGDIYQTGATIVQAAVKRLVD